MRAIILINYINYCSLYDYIAILFLICVLNLSNAAFYIFIYLVNFFFL